MCNSPSIYCRILTFGRIDYNTIDNYQLLMEISLYQDIQVIYYHLLKRLKFLKSPYLKLHEKLDIFLNFDFFSHTKKILLDNYLLQKNNEFYFKIGDLMIFFQPDYEIKNQEIFLSGICQVLTETFLFPEFFYDKVRINKDDVVLDIGANIGTTSLLFSKYVGDDGKIFAFEPVTWAVIEKNLDENKIINVNIIPKGISNVSGITEIQISDNCLDSTICKKEKIDYYKNSRIIDSITLDDFIKETNLNRIDFIKMDIEGAEEWALRGSNLLIERYRPKWSISSYHIDYAQEPQHDKLVSLLKKYRYNIKEIGKKHIYAW